MLKNRPRIFCFFAVLFLPLFVWGQGSYYASIDTGSALFVTDLHNLIYPHTRILYDQFDETNIANFASRDTTDGKKIVTCVYSGDNYLYTPPFTYAVYSREHTWCQSWMPTANASGYTSSKEYSDQHHLFPTHQNNANARRSNHPLGNVTTVSYQYIEGKLGTNASGKTVYQPRNSHKGDAARALLYMAVCYNGVGGYNWTFNNLNRVLRDSLSESIQDVTILEQWHNDDPPDAWEIARNNYVYSIQGNRNPFIDHPEYVGLIDFNTLTKKISAALAAEPTNYPDGYNTPTITPSSITVAWSDPIDGVLPSGYIVYANTSGTFTDPVDGTIYADDTILSDGSAKVNVPYGAELNSFTGLTSSTHYTFKLYPYNGDGGTRKYKTASFPASLEQSYSTTSAPPAISITSSTFSYVQNFDALANIGTSTWTDNTTIAGWYSNRTSYTAGTGGSNTGALYSFGSTSSTERSLGSVASSGTTTILYGVRFKNNSGGTITTIPLRYTGEQWRNGGNINPHKLTFEYKINASSISDASGWVAVPLLDFTGPIATATAGSLDGNNSANRITITSTISLLLLNGDEIWVRWTDVDDSGSDHGLSIDDFMFNQSGALLPVELSSFYTEQVRNGIKLSWHTATELNNHGFEIERSVAGGLHLEGGAHLAWRKIGFVEGNGTTNAPRSYSFVDNNVHGTVLYRLKQIDRDGAFAYSPTVEATVAAPIHFSLEQNYPNPFNPVTTIVYTIPQGLREVIVSLQVYDILGRVVATLVNDPKDAGRYEVRFDGSSLPSGIYFYNLRAGAFSATKKFSLLK